VEPALGDTRLGGCSGSLARAEAPGAVAELPPEELSERGRVLVADRGRDLLERRVGRL